MARFLARPRSLFTRRNTRAATLRSLIEAEDEADEVIAIEDDRPLRSAAYDEATRTIPPHVNILGDPLFNDFFLASR